MRLFVAADLDEPARAAVAAEQQRIRAALGDRQSGLKWIRAEQAHLTLAFIGDVADGEVPSVAAAVERPVEQRPFEAVFQGLGAFPPRGAPRALWIGLSRGDPEMQALQGEMAARLRAVGIALEDRPFSAHLTIARWRDGRPSDRTRALQHAGRGPI